MNSLSRRMRPQWPVLALALVLALGLLLFALQSVLNESVRRGVSLRKAAASESDQQARCNLLRGRPRSEQCAARQASP